MSDSRKHANGVKKNGSASERYAEPKRWPGEPPERFPFNRWLFADLLAWEQASPNFYLEEDGELVAYARSRFRTVWGRALDPSDSFGEDRDSEYVLRVERLPGVDEDAPQADPVDTDAVLASYERWRRCYSQFGFETVLRPGQAPPSPVVSAYRRDGERGPGYAPIGLGPVRKNPLPKL